jgi:hypothetical protein
MMLLMEFIQALGVMTKFFVISRFTLPNESRERVVSTVIDHGMVNREIVVGFRTRAGDLISSPKRRDRL